VHLIVEYTVMYDRATQSCAMLVIGAWVNVVRVNRHGQGTRLIMFIIMTCGPGVGAVPPSIVSAQIEVYPGGCQD
jgi:hypothetical protein